MVYVEIDSKGINISGEVNFCISGENAEKFIPTTEEIFDALKFLFLNKLKKNQITTTTT